MDSVARWNVTAKWRKVASRPGALAVLTCLGMAAGCGGVEPDVRARNVVVLVIDTLRADRLGCYGNPRDASPVIDALASHGVRFEKAFAHSNWTVPATASLLTSRLPADHGAGLAGSVRRLGEQPLLQMRPEVRSLASVLHDAGLATGLFSANPFVSGGIAVGFQTVDVEKVDARTLTGRAIAWLGLHAREPFFLYLQYMDLHQPLRPPDEFFHHFDAGVGSSRGDEHRNWRFRNGEDLGAPAHLEYRAHRIAAYDGALLFVDGEIGRLMATLDRLGVAESTMVVVSSDHGEEFWEHAATEAALGGDPRGIYGIGHGHSMFQELLHVPLVISGDGAPEGVAISQHVGHVDLAPTILSAVGLEVPRQMDGAPLQALWKGASTTWRSRPLIADSPAYGPNAAAVIVGDLKLIERDDGAVMLFDLAGDPRELVNLAAERPDLVTALRRSLDAARRSSAGTEPPREIPLDERTRQQLRELGYLEE